MNYGPTAFYLNFSLNRLVEKTQTILGMNASGGLMGGGGGGTRVHPDGSAIYHKSESHTVQLGSDHTVEQAFISALKSGMEKEITEQGAKTAFADIGKSGFRVEYCDQDKQGCVEVAGQSSGSDYYTVHASLAETSRDDQRTSSGAAWPPPEGTYYVVAFTPEDPQGVQDEFYEAGKRVLKASNESVRKRFLANQSRSLFMQNLKHAEVYSWKPLSPERKQKWAEVMRREIQVPPGYERFAIVYFLNEEAFKLYRDGGVDFEVLRTISAGEVPWPTGFAMRGYYLEDKNDSSSDRA